MHFAAFIEAGESMQRPEKYFRNNTANALTLLEALLAHGVHRFVFSSTAALYGTPEETPIQEDAPLHPTNAYGESKLLVEQMLDWLHRIHRLRYACLRYFNAAGAAGAQGEDHHPESHLIPIALQVALGVRQVIDTVRKVTGHAIPAQESPRRPGDPAVLVASPEKIKRELGWKPVYADLESIVRSAWNWRKAHPHGYSSNQD
jgi:UDP-glucose 4-epimerase